jgi:hypothetical protein
LVDWHREGETPPRKFAVYHTEFALIKVPVRASIRYTHYHSCRYMRRISTVGRRAEHPGSLHILFARCCQSGPGLAARDGETKGELFRRECTRGNQQHQRWAASLEQIQARTPDLLATAQVPSFFLLCQASPQLCRRKRRNNIVESRETIGFKPIVHKEPISRSL